MIFERRQEQLATDTAFAVTERNTNSATGVYQVRYDALALQANLRRDDSSQYGGKTTGGIAVGYKASPAWRFTAGYSTGFKAPSFNDLYYPGFSNPNLVPETSQNAELGAYWTSAYGDVRWEARAIGYHNQVKDLIVFGCDANFNCVPNNVDRATLEGVTLGLDLTWRDTRVVGSLDLQNPENDTTGNLLPRRARQHGALQVLQQVGPVQLGVEFVASSLRYDDPANIDQDGRLRHRQSHARLAVRERLDAARARQQRVRQELRARCRLFDRRRPTCSRACAGSREPPVRIVALALAMLASLTARAEVVARDDVGVTVTLPRPARRIVSLAPHATELLFAAGAGAAIVGVDMHSDWPLEARALPRVGDSATLDLERIVALAPDLIVTWPYTATAQLAQLRALGLPVFTTNPRAIAGIADDMERLAVARRHQHASGAGHRRLARAHSRAWPQAQQSAYRPRVLRSWTIAPCTRSEARSSLRRRWLPAAARTCSAASRFPRHS